jgi:hypothetical protein
MKEVASILYQPKNCNKAHRIVVTRNKRKDGQIDLLFGSAYNYQGIITNNEEMSEQFAIEFYNQRGDAENSNRYLLNDCNFNHLPTCLFQTWIQIQYTCTLCPWEQP